MSNKHSNNLQAILMDLGGVLIDIDWTVTYNCLRQKAQIQVYPAEAEPLLHAFERGEIDASRFRRQLCQMLGIELSDQEFDACWNAMIFDFPQERKDLILALRKRFPVFLVSNINQIHRQYVESQPYWEPELFDGIFWSCRLGSRKPEPEIFRKVLEQTGYSPSEVMFFDDLEQNVRSARQLGIHAVVVNQPLAEILRRENLLLS